MRSRRVLDHGLLGFLRLSMVCPAEPALVVLPVAGRAQWCRLVLRPNLSGHPVRGTAIIAEGPCDRAAIDARSGQHLLCPESDDLHEGHGWYWLLLSMGTK